VFLRQLLDAVDGIHARRYGYSSPVGDLIDHGFDVVSSLFLGLVTVHAFGIEDPFYFTLGVSTGWLIINLAFFSAYHTGVLLTNNGRIGVIELEFFVMIMLGVVHFFGHDWCKIPIENYSTLANVFDYFDIQKGEGYLGWFRALYLNELIILGWVCLNYYEQYGIFKDAWKHVKNPVSAIFSWTGYITLLACLFMMCSQKDLEPYTG